MAPLLEALEVPSGTFCPCWFCLSPGSLTPNAVAWLSPEGGGASWLSNSCSISSRHPRHPSCFCTALCRAPLPFLKTLFPLIPRHLLSYVSGHPASVSVPSSLHRPQLPSGHHIRCPSAHYHTDTGHFQLLLHSRSLRSSAPRTSQKSSRHLTLNRCALNCPKRTKYS